MKKAKILLAVLGAVLASTSAFAFANRYGEQYDDGAPTGVILAQRKGMNDSIELGRWHANLDNARAYAEANGVPLLAIWSNGDNCGHCKKWENNAISEPFETWMKDSGIVFYFGYYGDPGKGTTLGEWCYWCGRNNPTGKTLPLVRLYWKVNGTVIVDRSADGDTVDGNKGLVSMTTTSYRPDEPYYVPGDYHTYNMGGRYMIDYIKNAFPGYTPTPKVSYYGGEFGVVKSSTYGLQAEIGYTEKVYVPLTRTNEAAQVKSYNNRLVCIFPDNSATTNKIKWAVGQSKTNIAVTITGHTDGVTAGERVVLRLLDTTNGVAAANQITFVDGVANSPKNPFWIGERTEDTLPFGKWTMDIDVVTNKVKAFNARRAAPKAYAMVLVGGSLWCPDCVMADYHFYDYAIDGVNQFRAWAKEHNIALGVIDIPNYTRTGTTSNGSLLMYDVFTMSDNYLTGRNTFPKDENERYQSGAQYLSRHGVAPEDAERIIARNKKLVQKDTLHNGWRRPENTTNPYRLGVPTLLLLNDDGTVAARFDTWSKMGPTSYSTNFYTRLEEMIAQMDEKAEEANDDWRTTGETIVKRGGLDGRRTLSHVDKADVYKVEEGAIGKIVNFKLTGDATNSVTLAILSSANESVPLASATGALVDGLSATAEIPSANCYLKVSWGGGPADLIGSSVFEYALSSDNVLVATEAKQYETVTDGNPAITINVEQGKTYRITNVDEDKIAGVFTKGTVDGLYIAVATASATVYLKNSEIDGDRTVYKTEYQLWNTGRVGFDIGAGTAKEIDGDFEYVLKVCRLDGVAGVAKATISLDPGDVPDDGSIFEWTHEGMQFEWLDGSNDVKTVSITIKANSFADGDQLLSFKLTAVEGESDAGIDEATGKFTLLIRDDDQAVPGTLAIAGTNPAYARPMTVVAAGGSSVAITVKREVGSDGEVSGILKATAGRFSNDATTFDLDWASRSNEVKTVLLKLPEYSDATNSLQVTLASTSEAKVDPNRKYLTVKLAGCTAAFEEESENVQKSAVRYLAFATKLFVNPTTLGAGEVKVVKYSGSLAPGLSWSYDSELKTVNVEGTPVQAGEWTAVFQVSEDGAPGTTAVLTISVAELAESDEGEGSDEPINAAVAETRTIRDIIIEDAVTTNFIGLLTVTIPQTGRVSAKVRFVDGKTQSFLSTGWDGLDADGSTLVAALTDVNGGTDTMTVKIAKTGAVTIDSTIADTFIVPTVAWSGENPATSWQGYYTVSMPQGNVLDGNGDPAAALAAGAGYATLKMNAAAAINAGKMAYVGMLPNGKPFSGFGVLVPDPDSWNSDRGAFDYALLPVIFASETDRFSGVFKVLAGASNSVCRSIFAATAFKWTHVGERDALTRTAQLDAFGSSYNSSDNIAEACNETFAEDMARLKFFALVEELGVPEGFARGVAKAWDTTYTGVRVWNANGVNKIKIRPYEQEARERNGLSLSYNRSTGIVEGSFRIDFEDGSSATARYRGLVMMHWGAGCGVCNLGSELNLRPFISGAAWFDDDYSYLSAKGMPKTLSVRRGCSFTVGVNPGE